MFITRMQRMSANRSTSFCRSSRTCRHPSSSISTAEPGRWAARPTSGKTVTLSAAMPGALPEGEKMEEMLLQERIGTEAFREKAKAVSPAYRVSDRTPPTLLLHGTGDKVIAYSQSVTYLERLQAATVPSVLITVEGANHMEPCLFNSSEYTEEIINFLNTFMNPAL